MTCIIHRCLIINVQCGSLIEVREDANRSLNKCTFVLRVAILISIIGLPAEIKININFEGKIEFDSCNDTRFRSSNALLIL